MNIEMPGTIGSAKIIFKNQDMKKIGIIGLGFVGTAIQNAYTDLFVDVVKIDSDPSKRCTGTYDDIKDADAVFICVPSPMNADGSCNITPLTQTLENLKDFKGVIISKVTAPPDTYKSLQQKFDNLVHAPEFLTAANATQDYKNGIFSIIGGSNTTHMENAAHIIQIGQPNIKHVEYCTIAEASLAKYIINSFLSTKVVFMNEVAKVAELGGESWDVIRKLISLDSRIGLSHTQVPGPDGLYGFGGACFPKDTASLLNYAKSLDAQLEVLHTAVKKNSLLRLTDRK